MGARDQPERANVGEEEGVVVVAKGEEGSENEEDDDDKVEGKVERRLDADSEIV